jgi:raffinose/stachyose/melibiose transport system substrate-binding protein
MKLRVLLTVSLVTAIVLSASAKTAQGALHANRPASAPFELTMMSGWPLNQSRGVVLQKLVAAFNKSHASNVHVTVNINPDWNALQQQIRTMVSAGNAPNLFQYNFNPNDLALQKSGKLMNFTPYMDASWKARFNPQDLKALTVNGQLLSIPFEQDGAPFYYNKALFAKAGVSSFPKTWTQFFQDCSAFKKVGVSEVSMMTQDDAWLAMNVFTYLATSIAGPNAFLGKSLNTPAIVNAATMLKQAFACSTQDATGANYDVASNNFLTGKTAMISDGPWAIGPIESQSKTLSQIGVAAGPAMPGGKGKPGLIVTDAQSPWAAGKPKSTAQAQAVVAFLTYLTSPSSAAAFTLQGNIAVSPIVHLSATQKKGVNPILLQFIKLYGKAPQRVVDGERVLKPAAVAQLPTLLQGLILGSTSPQQFAQQLQADNR